MLAGCDLKMWNMENVLVSIPVSCCSACLSVTVQTELFCIYVQLYEAAGVTVDLLHANG